jgi:hypothetical protein
LISAIEVVVVWRAWRPSTAIWNAPSALSSALRRPLGQVLQQPTLTGRSQPGVTRRSASIEVNCSPVPDGPIGRPAPARRWASVVIWRRFLDHQIRRELCGADVGVGTAHRIVGA